MKLRMLVAGLLIGVAAFAAEAGGDLFQKATTLVRAGNLEEAIKLYQRVATEFASDHALAAKALMAEAKCYETLGQDKATKLYEQVAREYHDQPDQAAAANARLVVLRQGNRVAAPVTMTQRKIESPGLSGGRFDYLETDGQRVVFKDKTTGAVMMSDLEGGGKRVIFRQPKDRIVNTILASRDLSLILLTLLSPDKSQAFALIRSDGTGFHEIAGESSGWLCMPEFAWDSKSVLFCQRQPDGSPQVVRLWMGDGEIHKIPGAEPNNYRFSPDGRFIAYNAKEGVFVMPSQGGEPKLVSEQCCAQDWTRDGRHIILDVTTDDGAEALRLLPVKDGERAGDPIFIRYGDFGVGRTAANGAFIYNATPPGGQYTAWLGKLDGASGSLGWEKLSLTGSNDGEHSPTWSPDSNQIAYVAYNGPALQYENRALRLRNIATGEERELYKGKISTACLWSAQHASIYCTQQTPRKTTELLSISAETGRAEPLGAVPDTVFSPIFLTRDDRAIYATGAHSVMRWEIGAPQATTVYDNSGFSWMYDIHSIASPDWVTRWSHGKAEIRPMAGGDWRPLVSISDTTQVTFTPDGNWFVYQATDVAGKHSLFRVATTGGQPERLGDFASGSANWGGIWVSPDGKKIISDTRNPDDLWALDNIEPKQQTAKSAPSSKPTQMK
jgi:Tol biopolymer transport system component